MKHTKETGIYGQIMKIKTKTVRKKYSVFQISKRYCKINRELAKHYIKFLLFQKNKKPIVCRGKIVNLSCLKTYDKKLNYILLIRNFKTKKSFSELSKIPLKNIRIFEKNFLQIIQSDKVLMNFFENHLIMNEQQQLTKFDFLTTI